LCRSATVVLSLKLGKVAGCRLQVAGYRLQVSGCLNVSVGRFKGREERGKLEDGRRKTGDGSGRLIVISLDRKPLKHFRAE